MRGQARRLSVMANKWANRIIEYRPDCLLSEFLDNKRNYRIHPKAQKRGVVKILDRVGKVLPLAAYYSERYGGLTLYNGHLRKNLKPDETWPVVISNLTDEEADFVIMTLDPSTGMADIDYDILNSLTEDVGPLEEDIAAILATLEVELPEIAYSPVTSPQIARTEYSGDDVEKARQKLGGRFSGGTDYIDVMCPSCATEFSIRKQDVK
jgi:hypothetical protein